MTRLAKKAQKIFCGDTTAADKQVIAFGSAPTNFPVAVTGIVYSMDPDVIQTTDYSSGWDGAAVGWSVEPGIMLEDMNATNYLVSRAIAYDYQAGIPEWDAATTYYIGSLVNDGVGGIYSSITDDNLNNALTGGHTYWKVVKKMELVTVTGPGCTVDCSASDNFLVSAGSGGNKTIAMNNITIGRTINILVTGASGNTIAFTSNQGDEFAVRTQTSSVVMTSGYTLCTAARTSNTVSVTFTHGLA